MENKPESKISFKFKIQVKLHYVEHVLNVYFTPFHPKTLSNQETSTCINKKGTLLYIRK